MGASFLLALSLWSRGVSAQAQALPAPVVQGTLAQPHVIVPSAIDPGGYPEGDEHSLAQPVAMAATGLGLVLVSGMVALVSARATLAVDRTMQGRSGVYGPRLDINDDDRIDHADRAIFQRTFYVSLGVGVLGLGVGMV